MLPFPLRMCLDFVRGHRRWRGARGDGRALWGDSPSGQHDDVLVKTD